MPELPEVETIARDLNSAGVVGKTVTCASVSWPRTIAAPSPAEFCRLMERTTIAAVRRRGKFLVFDLAGGRSLLIHLRMSGRLHLVEAGVERLAHEHVALTFADGSELRFHDTRKFGRITLTADAGLILARLGPEPLEPGFTAGRLQVMLRARRRLLKPLLLDQTFVAGLGNIYVDEALWESALHPLRLSDSLSAAETRSLHRAIRRVLRRGLKNLGTSLGSGKANFTSVARRRGRNRDELRVFRRTGEACPRCAAVIERIVVGQRGTHVCPKCQVSEGFKGPRGQVNSKGFPAMQEPRRGQFPPGYSPDGSHLKVDAMYWERLQKADLPQLCARTQFAPEGERRLRFDFLNEAVLVDVGGRRLGRLEDGSWVRTEDPLLELATVLYLANVKDVYPLGRDIVGPRDLKEGHFFQGPHEIRTAPLLERYGEDLAGFRQAAARLGGEPVEMADAACRLKPFPRVHLYYLLWAGDEEFPARMSVLLDRSIEETLAADAVWALINRVSAALRTGSASPRRPGTGISSGTPPG